MKASLETKLMLSMSLLGAAALGTVSVLISSASTAQINREQELKLALYGQLAAKQLEPALAFDDDQTAREVFASLAQDRELIAMSLLDERGRTMASWGPAPAKPPVTFRASGGLWRRPGELGVLTPIATHEGIHGSVLMLSSTRHADEVRRRALATIALVSAGVLLVVLLGVWRVAKNLTARIARVEASASKVASGQLDQPPLTEGGEDEIGRLIRAHNAMVVDLNRLVKQTQELAEREQVRLAQLVSERTKELEASVDRYKNLVDNTKAIPWEYDLATKLCFLPPGVMARLKLDPEQLKRSGFFLAITHPDDRARLSEHIERGVERAHRGQPTDDRLEYRISASDGSTMELQTFFSFPSKGTTLRGISLDVTETKLLELNLRQAQKLESVGRLAAGVAHEINTPVQFVSDSVHFVRDAMGDLLSVLKGYRELTAPQAAAESLRDQERSIELDYLIENVPAALDRSLEGMQRVAAIVRSMKEFAHPEQREMTMTDLNRAVENTATIARNEYKYVADLELKLGELPLVECHAGDINQVILNLIVNAAHAIGDVVKDTESKGKIEISTRVFGDQVEISVKDTGGGIPSAIRERVYDPFFTTKAVGKGTGQGLAIARSIVNDKHHGTIDFESVVGQGTTFVIRLPVAQAHPEQTLAA